MLRRLLPVLIVLCLALATTSLPAVVGGEEFTPVEIVALRGETSKTYYLGAGRYQHVVGNTVHWKYDYSDETEEWKEADLSWEVLPDGSRQVTQAPYILVHDGLKLTYTDRKTGELATLELLSVQPEGTPFIIVPQDVGVAFQHILTGSTLPFEAQFRLTGSGRLNTQAFDLVGDLAVETAWDGNIFTERLSTLQDPYTGKAREAVGTIRIDPTLTIQPCSADAHLSSFSPNSNYGSSTAMYISPGVPSLVSFSLAALPSGAIVSSATLGINVYQATASPVGHTYRMWRLRRTDWVESQATWNSYKTG